MGRSRLSAEQIAKGCCLLGKYIERMCVNAPQTAAERRIPRPRLSK